MNEELRIKNLTARKEMIGRDGRFGSTESIETVQSRPNLSK